MSTTAEEYHNFIEEIIEEDLTNGMPKEQLRFRFPPEPNGYLHIGHAKAICLNFGLGKKYGAPVNLRFDDTNPEAEEQEYVDSIRDDVRWMGFNWENECYASDYFQQLYDWAVELIKAGNAYVDDQTSEQIAEQRKDPYSPGVDSPYRNRSVAENLKLFEQMKKGELEEGSHVLRAKIDMASPNMNMRDPVMYRILNRAHHRTGTDWKIYPMYDWAHGESDYVEGISHSLCTLEFKNHRPLYEWYLNQIDLLSNPKPKQREFARGNVSFMITSKRKLRQLVEENIVDAWDDPRMPTISGMRRRGFTAASIRAFWDRAGVAKRDNVLDIALLEYCVREDLNKVALRRMAVLDPIKVVITNYPQGQVEMLMSENNPEDEEAGFRELPFSREIYIERTDFMEDPPKKYFRMAPGRNVRLKSAYILHCDEVVKSDNGDILEVRCTYYPNSKSGEDVSGVKAKGTLHWVSVDHAVESQVNLYDRLFTVESPDSDKEISFLDYVNPDSKVILSRVYLEPILGDARPGEHYQFMRQGYFVLDKESNADKLIFNRTVTLRDSWKK